MLRTPTEFELNRLLHTAAYDPVKAHEYYMRNRKLKGRKKGSSEVATASRPVSAQDPRTGKTREQIAKQAKARQRQELAQRVKTLEGKLQKLEALIAKKERDEDSEDRKSKAKKERARKERDKPKSAAEKAKDAREAKKYRDKNQQKLKSKADDKKSGGGSKKSSSKKESSVSELKALATKVRGQIAVAKQKLAAL